MSSSFLSLSTVFTGDIPVWKKYFRSFLKKTVIDITKKTVLFKYQYKLLQNKLRKNEKKNLLIICYYRRWTHMRICIKQIVWLFGGFKSRIRQKPYPDLDPANIHPDPKLCSAFRILCLEAKVTNALGSNIRSLLS